MLHPYIKLRKSSIEGKGLFAIKRIPKGTILLVSPSVRVYTIQEYKKFSPRYRAILRKYACEDDEGNLVYHADDVKYWNHSCNPNATYIGDAEIAIRDINAGEEVTYDYGLIHPKWLSSMKCSCGSENCRKSIRRASDESNLVQRLNSAARNALKSSQHVLQPLVSREDLRNLVREYA